MSVIEAPVPATREASPVTREVTEADVLERAADLLEEFGWCQRTNAKSAGARDNDCGIFGSRVVAFCAEGAIVRASLELGRTEFGRPSGWGDFPLGAAAAIYGISSTWNDAPGRTKAEVVAKLRDAAARARA